jgi:NAD-dependent dihydropyrimidine dehydrogenase PreA subunit
MENLLKQQLVEVLLAGMLSVNERVQLAATIGCIDNGLCMPACLTGLFE